MNKSGHFVVDDCIGIALLTALAFKKKQENYILLASNLFKAQKIYSSLVSFLDEQSVLLFASDELIRAETLAESKELVSSRLYVLSKLKEENKHIIVTNLASFTRFLPKPQLFFDNVFSFKVGNHYNISEIKHALVISGFQAVKKIDQTLQFASRGEILDIFSANLNNPIRLEFFDDELESIRTFDIASQVSQDAIKEVSIIPSSEFLLEEDEFNAIQEKVDAVLEKDKQIVDPNIFDKIRINVANDLELLLTNTSSPRLYKYYGFLQKKNYSLLDYINDPTVVLVDEDSISRSESLLIDESYKFTSELFEMGKSISHLALYQDMATIFSRHPKAEIIHTSPLLKHSGDIEFDLHNVPYQSSKKSDAINIIHRYLNDNYTLHIALATQEQQLFVTELLDKENIPYERGHEYDLPNKTRIIISVSSLAKGFQFNNVKIAFLSSYELFNEKVNVARFDMRFKEGTILKSFEDLEPGDYVVHEYQGIGQFLQMETLEVEGVHRDNLKIAYFGNEILYVPLSQFQLVRKYLGKEGLSPRLSHLHSKDWENTKKRIKERIADLANRLFNLYTERSKIQGYQFPEDDEYQKDFEAQCPFTLTKDQARSVLEIKHDMESSSPMDRLLCGDVGFGKTEVAFQAIFKAISAGKQVAILCPTTLLARQHYQRAKERFSPFDIRVALLTRLVASSVQKEAIEQIAEGKVHLVIGTHRLLSKEIVFKDLGLLVIDEEQRFGVEQKERLKELKSNVDVLTLSATPIPRTLQISLLGVRSMSLINTPPKDRMPIQTYVIPFDINLVKELIERELGRNGQVYYLHNNVSTLYQQASKLQKLLPGVSIGVAHGQMEKGEMEEVMNNFYNGTISVLVCTTIIENGIDIPNANMIIVEDSENYGLSQLYQIKGRVGRSDRIAYAYLMYSEHKLLKETAQKRLQAIQDFTELGSGYKIAQRDLLIRGAGDILGPEQAGFIDSIGLDMYIKLLNDAVKEKQTGIIEESEETKANLTLNIDAYIPENYAKEGEKIELYQEILAASSTDSLAKLKIKTIDIYGRLPKEVQLLFQKRNIDLLSQETEVYDISEKSKYVEMNIGEPYINMRGIGNIMFESFIPFISRIKVSYINHKFKIQLTKTPSWLDDLEGLLMALQNIKETNKVKVIE